MVVVSGRVEMRHRRMTDGLDRTNLRLSQARRQPLDPELLGSPGSCGPVRLEVGDVGQGRGRVERGDVPVGAELLRLGREPPSGDHRFQIGVGLQECRGRLLADPPRAGDLVRRIAAQGDEVAHLLRVDAVPLAHLGRADPGQLADAAYRLEDRDVGSCELVRVAVGGRNERGASARPLAGNGRGEKVVGLEALLLAADDARRRDERRQQGELLDDLGIELAARLVRLEQPVAVGRDEEGVPADDDRARTLGLPEAQEHRHEADQRVGRAPSSRLNVFGRAWNARCANESPSTARSGFTAATPRAR